MNTIGNYFRSIGILHAALCISTAIIIFLLRFMGKDHVPSSNGQVFFIVGIVIAAINLIISRMMLFKTVTPAQQAPNLDTKLTLFRSGFIIQMALLEGAAIINIIFWFMGGNTFNLGISLGLLFLMVFRRPTRSLVQGLVFNTNEDSRIVYNDEGSIE